MAHHPHRIFIIRHAERPADSTPPNPNLTDKGRARAAALVNYPFPDLAGIFAAATTLKSARSVQTVTPLAAARDNMKIHDKVKDQEFPLLVSKVLAEEYKDTDVLICWHHEQIPHLAAALGANIPPKFRYPDVYDRVWVLRYEKDGSVTREDLPQRLLPGDSPT
jgi:broad specificity phosphatase PhoE